jgi:hypothetical protein
MTLSFPWHEFEPKSLLIFVETSWFTRDWNDLGLNDESDLASLQLVIMSDPKGPPVIKGTGGLRKLRFSPVGWGKGKSGALRVVYVHYEEFGNVLLVAVYPKNVKDDLSVKECKAIKAMIEHHRQLLSERYYT